jgi:glycosyltransferase involved in cell wall biosynthesis
MALFGVVDEWLRAGHEIDFFSPGTWIKPERLENWPGFRYTSVPHAAWMHVTQASADALRGSALGRGFGIARSALAMGLSTAQHVAHEAAVEAAIVREHSTRQYDAFISINRTSPYTLGDVMPLVSWSQGAPRCESDFIRREGAIVRGECGVSGWALLRGAYAIKDAQEARTLERSTGVIVASEWARSMWLGAGVPDDRLAVIPFPVDAERFTATTRPANRDSFVFLWSGRIVPRKRFPLALEAFDRLRRRRPGARLLVAGGRGYAGVVPTYHLPELGPGVEKLGTLPSSEMPALLARTDVLFQPSENENFGAGPVEGLACGIPSVVGPTNGTSDALGDTAFRFERYEAEDVAAALERAMDAVLADPAGIARRARRLAEETLAMPVIAARGARAVEAFIDLWHERGRSRLPPPTRPRDLETHARSRP